jgi:hypothetical protein
MKILLLLNKLYEMKFKKLVIGLSILFTVVSISSQAQEYTRKLGLSATLQGSQYGIALPIWAGEKYVIEPIVSVKYAQSIGSDFGFGLSQRFYFRNKSLAPYAGVNLGAIISAPSSNSIPKSDTHLDLVAGAAFGAEYFIMPQFSFRVEAQLM